jgi:hypothetical protein
MIEFLSAIRHEFLKHKSLADRGIAQLDGEWFFARPVPHANSVAIIVKHLSGSMTSRWSSFLTTDGEKQDRDRDAEFILTQNDTHAALMTGWETGWNALFSALKALQEEDLHRTVIIRGEPHHVDQALLRGLSHATYHVGQILYVVRCLQPHADWLTIPPGKSKEPRSGYLAANQ